MSNKIQKLPLSAMQDARRVYNKLGEMIEYINALSNMGSDNTVNIRKDVSGYYFYNSSRYAKFRPFS